MQDTRYTLIKRLKDQHDQSAWTLFTETYQAYIYVVLSRAGVSHDDAVDLQQEILVKIWKALPSFDYQPGKAKFRTWLSRVIKNTAYSYFSSRGAERERVTRYATEKEITSPESDVIENILDEEWKAYLSNLALQNLEKTVSQQSISIFKRMLAGESSAALAAELGLKENSIHRIKNRTRDKVITEIARLRRELE